MPFGPLTPFWVVALTLMLGGLFVSSVINGDPLRWSNVAVQYAMAYLFIPILLMGQERRITQLLPVFFVLGTTLSEAIGITATFFFTMQDTVDYLGDGFITGNQRLGSMAGQPNPNGAVIAFSMPMLIYTLIKGSMPKLLGLVCGVTLLWGLMLSASFTGFFASMTAIGITLALIGIRHLVRLGLVIAVAAGLFFASGAPLPKAFQERVGGAVETGDISQAGTFLNRSELIAEAWGFAEDTAVIGMGVDRYRELSHHDNPVHNLYLLIWNEGGAVAFLGLVGLLAMLCIFAVGGLRRSREAGGMACAVVIVFLIYTASYPHMYSRMWMVPVFTALGVIYGRRDEVAVNRRDPAAAAHPPPASNRPAPQA
jgi:O-antigen ligase